MWEIGPIGHRGRPGAGQDNERQVRGHADHDFHQRPAGRVYPVEVVDYDAPRPARRHPADPQPGRQLQSNLELVGVDQILNACFPAFFGQQQHFGVASQHGDGPKHQPRRLGIQVRCNVVPEQEMSRHDAGLHALLVGQPVDHVADGPIGRVHAVRRVVDPHPGKTGGPGVVLHLTQQPGFPDTCFAAQEDCPASAGVGGAAEDLDHAGPLSIPTYQRRRLAAWVADDLAFGAQPVDRDRSPLTAQQAFAQMIHADARLRGGHCRVVEQHFVRIRELLQARGRSHGIAGQGHGPSPSHFPESGHDFARGDADAQFHVPIVAGHVSGQGRLHLQGAQAGSERVVVVGDRYAEDRQHRIAGELLDRAAEMDDGMGKVRQSAVDSGADLLGIEFVDQARVTHDVGEQGCHDPAIADLQPIRNLIQPPAALVAEPGAWNRRSTTVGAEHRDLYGTPE